MNSFPLQPAETLIAGSDNSQGFMTIRRDDLAGAEIKALLEEHLRSLEPISPRESRHALDLTGLHAPDITVWTIWSGAELAGYGALKEIAERHGEIKSMRTAHAYLRKGVATQILQHVLNQARERGYTRLSLETGSMDYFEPARRLYSRFGFVKGEPFASYRKDRNSVFMTKEL